MSALDVLAARRRVLVTSLERATTILTEMAEGVEKQKRAIESIDNASRLLEDQGFIREWPDDELGRMIMVERTTQ